ncbi:MAG TPA: hypothetical protein G4O04_01410 [Anaerolineae bacterium]|nr:hypothetical protein [Anaerolineae bacterium]HID85451.1 hypothetical protein [Anaerolineales bacterium]HIQ09552.1 hypothetical protein [Anaerolineaceae bacterium]
MGVKQPPAKSRTSWKTRTLLFSALLGALTGLGAGYLMVQRAEAENRPPQLNAKVGVKLGLLVLGLLRQVGQILEE